MKKYTLFLFVFALFITLLGFNVNVAGASNCAPGDLFNSATGKACDTITTPIECMPGDLFSSVTGQPCGLITPTPTPLPTIPVPFCPEFSIGIKGEAVKTFQKKLNAQGASLKIDGSYGPQTRAIAERYCNKPFPIPTPFSTPIPTSVVITGVSGPQSLNVNQQGTWSVTASNKNGGNLSYSVNWGDEIIFPCIAGTPCVKESTKIQQEATFTHSYSQVGIYKIVFTVRSENTMQCIKAPCPSNGGSAQTSLSVNVGNVIPPSSSTITVLSPNGGEPWIKGTKQTIKWNAITSTQQCASDQKCAQNSIALATYDIQLFSYSNSVPCTEKICPMYMIAPFTIAKNISNNYYDWTVGIVGAVKNLYDGFATDGSYTIQVCQSGTNICDSSDSYFKIVSLTTNTSTSTSPQ